MIPLGSSWRILSAPRIERESTRRPQTMHPGGVPAQGRNHPAAQPYIPDSHLSSALAQIDRQAAGNVGQPVYLDRQNGGAPIYQPQQGRLAAGYPQPGRPTPPRDGVRYGECPDVSRQPPDATRSVPNQPRRLSVCGGHSRDPAGHSLTLGGESGAGPAIGRAAAGRPRIGHISD